MNRIAWVPILLLVAGGCATATQPSARADRGSPDAAPTKSPLLSRAQRGVEFLVQHQSPEGFWGTGLETRGFEIYSMVPGSHDAFRVATTALCVMALEQALSVDAHWPGAEEAYDRGVEFLVASGKAHRDSGNLIYNIWAHTYALEALARAMRSHDDPRIREQAQWHLDRMIRYATYMGGWNYYDFEVQTQQPSLAPTSFGTAAGLVALYEARKSGLDVPQKLIEMSLRRLEECRLPNGVFLYGWDSKYVPRMPANMPRGAVGRTQPSNYALWLWDFPKMDQAQAINGLDLFFENHVYLEMGRKRQYPHEAWYQTSGYYYYFDHYYASLLIERLPPEQRREYRRKLADVVARHQEPDGSWWDYAMWDYHKPYGTAFAIMTLLRCDGRL